MLHTSINTPSFFIYKEVIISLFIDKILFADICTKLETDYLLEF
jgi:hypothetical protein